MSRTSLRFLTLALALAVRVELLGALPLDGADEITRLAPVTVSGAPRSLVTLAVAVPLEFRDQTALRFRVVLTGAAEVLGRLEGAVTFTPGGAPRPVMLTLRVPSDAMVGFLDIADVVFVTPDERALALPIILRVPTVRSVHVSGPRELGGLRSGDRAELTYTVTNDGNAPEDLVIQVAALVPWPTRVGRNARIVVPARGSAEFDVTFSVPVGANIGDFAQDVVLRGRGLGGDTIVVTRQRTILRVSEVGINSPGLMIEPVVAFASGLGGSAIFTGARFHGPIGDGLEFRATVMPRANRGGAAAQGLASVGASGAPIGASLSGRGWTVSAGGAGVQLSSLTGIGAFGQGVMGTSRTAEREIVAMVARPVSAFGSQGILLGAGYWQRTELGRVGASASHFSESGGIAATRGLTALGADIVSPIYGTLQFNGGLAARRTPLASGLGVSAGAVHERDGEMLSLQITHAPGGSASYARAESELQLSGSRDLSERVTLDASLSAASDNGPVIRDVRSQTWTVGQRFRATDNVSLIARLRSTEYEAGSSLGAFGTFGAGNDELLGGARFDRGRLGLSVEGLVGRVSRSTGLLDGRVDVSRSRQRSVNTSARYALTSLGNLDASGSVQYTEAGVGLPAETWQLRAAWSEIPLVVGRTPVRLSSEVRVQEMGNARSFVVLRSALSIALRAGFDVALSAERNPYFRDAMGRPGWIAAMRVSTTREMLPATALGPQGWVFEDLNGNGSQDDGERGVGGVILRLGGDQVVSQRDGRYRLPSRSRGRPSVLQSSLPEGLVVHPMLQHSDSVERRAIPLIPTGSIALELQLQADPDGRVPSVELKDAMVWIRDQRGLQWVGRAIDSATFLFENVPAGVYEMRFDVSKLSEGVRVPDDLRVEVPVRTSRRVVVPLRGRAVRIITPPRGNNSRGDRGSGK